MFPLMTRVGPIERRMVSEVAAEPVNERDWVRIFVGDPPFVKAVHASCTPVIVILGCGVRIPDQRQVVDVHGVSVGFHAPPVLHGRNVSCGDCTSVGVLLES